MLELEQVICRLDEVKGNEEVRALSYAKFPGTHCPLFGVAMTASFISDMAVLVLGTGECTYYCKGFAHNNQKGKDNFYSMIIGKTDLTFGCGKQVLKALKNIEKEDKPKAIMVVTTCVLEVIGEDIESLLIENQADFNAHLLLVNTEHFKCGSHIPGMERALLSLVGMMERRETREKSINILGHRKDGVEQTEVIDVLAKEGVCINSVIPSKCSIKDISKASEAALNVVVDFTALPLAKEMERKLGIPYVYFGRHLLIDKIDKEYEKIEQIFGIQIISLLDDRRNELKSLFIKAQQLFEGKSFIYGNTPMMAFEVSDFLCEIGMIPLFLQIREYYEEERQDMDKILQRGYNPYIAQIANIAPMQAVYDQLKPDIYLGHENPMALFQKGIVQMTADEVISKIGYEVPIEFLKKIIRIYEFALNNPDVPAGMISMAGLPAGGVAAMGNMFSRKNKDNTTHKKGVDEWLEELSSYEKKTSQESKLDSNGLTPEMARAVSKGMPLSIAKMISKGGNK